MAPKSIFDILTFPEDAEVRFRDLEAAIRRQSVEALRRAESSPTCSHEILIGAAGKIAGCPKCGMPPTP